MSNLALVMGLGRSGTTMLHMMLGNADDALSVGEVYAKFRPFRTHHFKPACPCEKAYGDCFWRGFDNVCEQDFYSTLRDKSGVDWIVDESKSLTWCIDSQTWAHNSGINVFNILIYKEPVNQIHSFWKRQQNPENFANRFVGYYGRFIELGLPFVSINYEELATDPSGKLRQLCNVLGMNYFEGKERFWEKSHCHLFGSKGIRNQMHSGNFEIKTEAVNSKEFDVFAQPLLNSLEDNQEFQTVFHKLRSNEVNRLVHYPPEAPISSRVKKPYWYYVDKLANVKRRHFPKQWEHRF